MSGVLSDRKIRWAEGRATRPCAAPGGSISAMEVLPPALGLPARIRGFAGATMPAGDIHDRVCRAQAGDLPAIERLLELVRPPLVRLADRFTDRHHPSRSAADLVQDAELQAWQK